MKYTKIFRTPKEPNILNVMFPTILPFDFLMILWYLMTLKFEHAHCYFFFTIMMIALNKDANKIYVGEKRVADAYSLFSLSKAEAKREFYRFQCLVNEYKKKEENERVNI